MKHSPGRYAVLAAIVALVVAGWLVMAGRHTPPEGADLSRSKASANGIYEVTIEPEAEPVEQGPLHTWLARVKLPDGTPVVNAQIGVDGGMPAHGHGLPTAPKASHVGDGVYRIEGMRFNMGGLWELRLSLNGPTGEDEVVFNIQL
ncbi:MAG: FixH family protein [Rhizobiaceae bacterium]|nr:FixH family protein [Rhizobiaceae bacterium]